MAFAKMGNTGMAIDNNRCNWVKGLYDSMSIKFQRKEVTENRKKRYVIKKEGHNEEKNCLFDNFNCFFVTLYF